MLRHLYRLDPTISFISFYESTFYLLFDEAFNYSIYATNNYKILDREAYNRINKKAPEGIGMAVRIYHGKIIHIDGIYNETEKIIEIR